MLQSLSSSSSRTSPVQTSVIQSTKTYQNGSTIETTTPTTQDLKNNLSNNLINSSSTPSSQQITNNLIITEPNSNNLLNHELNDDLIDGNDFINDVEMENGHGTNGNGNGYKNGNNDTICDSIDTDEEMGEFFYFFCFLILI